MKSWAVTRGPSLVPGEKRLAVQVEDHPIDYNKFEGTIPRGEYGGGTVMVWDRGTWKPEGDPQQGLAKGHLSFHLAGKKLAGGWHLVRMRRRPGREARQLAADQAGRRGGAQRARQGYPARAAAVGEERAQHGGNRRAQAQGGAQGSAQDRAKTPRRRSETQSQVGTADPAAESSGPRRDDAGGPNAGRRAQASAARGAARVSSRPASPRWSPRRPTASDGSHEIKFDGYRIQARLDRGKVKLMTRKGLDWTKKFPAIAQAVAKLRAKTALIDGELVVEDAKGVSRFSLLQQDLKSARHGRLRLYAFDLLHLDGADLRRLPLSRRKAALSALLRRGHDRAHLRFSKSLHGSGPQLLRHACKLGLEGIMSKLADAPYHSGRGRDWLKAKCSDRQELVVAGLCALVGRRARGRRAGAGLLCARHAALCRAHRHRLQP